MYKRQGQNRKQGQSDPLLHGVLQVVVKDQALRDAGHSGRWHGRLLLDDNGVELSDWSMRTNDDEDMLLFDQTGRIAAIDDAPLPPDLPPLGVPAPGSLALALAGLMPVSYTHL